MDVELGALAALLAWLFYCSEETSICLWCRYRRVVYDFALWAKHRDVNRYLYNLRTIPG